MYAVKATGRNHLIFLGDFGDKPPTLVFEGMVTIDNSPEVAIISEISASVEEPLLTYRIMEDIEVDMNREIGVHFKCQE